MPIRARMTSPPGRGAALRRQKHDVYRAPIFPHKAENETAHPGEDTGMGAGGTGAGAPR